MYVVFIPSEGQISNLKKDLWVYYTYRQYERPSAIISIMSMKSLHVRVKTSNWVPNIEHVDFQTILNWKNLPETRWFYVSINFENSEIEQNERGISVGLESKAISVIAPVPRLL